MNSKYVIPRVIWILGASMFFINISNVTIISLSSVYMTTIGISVFWIGLLEGVIEAISFFMKLFSGVISDYLKKRKSIIMIGYGLTITSMFLTSLSVGYGSIFVARLIGRSGNGIQATPRDAMVGDVAPAHKRGSSYGLMRSLGVLGSIIGSGLSIVAMWYTANNFTEVFYLATIPSIIAFVLLGWFVKEPKIKNKKTREGEVWFVESPNITKTTVSGEDVYKFSGKFVYQNSVNLIPSKDIETRKTIKLSDLNGLGKKFWYLMGIVSIFMLDQFSSQWTTLVAYQKFNLPVQYVPLISMVFCISYCLSSYPVGLLSDKIGRFKILMAGITVLMIADLVIASATSLPMLFVGIFMLGCQTGIAQNTFASLIADYVPKDILGTAFGIYYLFSGLATICAGIFGGVIAEVYGINHIFIISFFLSAVSLWLVCLFQRVK
jgi:MFS family permease